MEIGTINGREKESKRKRKRIEEMNLMGRKHLWNDDNNNKEKLMAKRGNDQSTSKQILHTNAYTYIVMYTYNGGWDPSNANSITLRSYTYNTS